MNTVNHYFSFAVQSDSCVGSFNTLNDLSNKVCVPNKTEELNLNVFNMITGKSESKIQQKIYPANVNINQIEENLIQIKSRIMINVDMNVRNIIFVKKIICRTLLYVVAKM